MRLGTKDPEVISYPMSVMSYVIIKLKITFFYFAKAHKEEMKT